MQNADELERYMLTLINEERAAVGAPPLALETSLNASAEDHSEWMLSSDVFSHTGQGGSSATDRMRAADFELSGSWMTAENIAVQSERGAEGFRDDVENLHQSLMNSPGHRANLLNPDLDYIGIGIEAGDFNFGSGEVGSVIVTQNFGSTQGAVSLDTGEAVAVAEPDVMEPDVVEPEVTEPEVTEPEVMEPEVVEPEAMDPVEDPAEVPVEMDPTEVPEVIEPEVIDEQPDDPIVSEPEPELEPEPQPEPEPEQADPIIAERGQIFVTGTDADDVIIGNCGLNLLSGGAGADTFVFTPYAGLDLVLDFEAGVDRLDLSGFGFDMLTDATNTATQYDDHVLMTLGCGDTLIVLNTALADVEAAILI